MWCSFAYGSSRAAFVMAKQHSNGNGFQKRSSFFYWCVPYMYNEAIVEACVPCTSGKSSAVLNQCRVKHLHIDCTIFVCTKEGWWHYTRYYEWYYKKTENMALSLSTGLERNSMSTSIFSPKELRPFRATIHCKKLKIPTLCSLLYSGGQILSISSADSILVKHRVPFPFTEEGTLLLALLWWIEVVIVLFSLLEISPVAHPQPKLLQNFPINISAS